MSEPRVSRKGTPGRTSALIVLLSQYRGRMALLAAVSFVGALFEAMFLVIITGVAMAMVAQKHSVGPVLGYSPSVRAALLAAAIVLVVRLALNLVGIRTSATLTADVTSEQRQVLSHAYLRTSWAVQQAEATGRLQELLTTFVQRANNTIMTLAQVVTALLSLIAFLATGLFIDVSSTLAVLVALALVGAILAPLRRRIRGRSQESARAGLDFASAVSELGSLGLEMQAFGVQDRFVHRIDALTQAAAATTRRVQTLTGSLAPIYTALAYGAVLGGVAILSILGVDDLTVIGAVMLLMLRSLSYGQQLAAASGSLAANAPFLDQINQTVERYRGTPASTGNAVPAKSTPIEAYGVKFGYTPDRVALALEDFRLNQGEIVGVIGPSGAGKSTLAQLLLGLREPTSGRILVDEVDLRNVHRAWWASRVAFVSQDALLFTGTVAENIRFFRDGIDNLSLLEAARQANVLADIQALPNGFDTHLGERGSQLSGGQRQRISIARALAGSPELLVLDEPTSALDGQSEALIRDTLMRLKGKVTVVIVAHRMSTVDICDRIMVIESGRMTAFETPEVLHGKSAFYQRALDMAGLYRDRNL